LGEGRGPGWSENIYNKRERTSGLQIFRASGAEFKF
jgi:hypothetical protein